MENLKEEAESIRKQNTDLYKRILGVICEANDHKSVSVAQVRETLQEVIEFTENIGFLDDPKYIED